MSEVIQNFWASEASKWSLQNKNPLVGWYTEHNEDPREEELLFRGVPVKVNSLALEYGCGPGRNIIKFKDWFQQIDGADISKDILEKVHINLAEANVPLPNLFHIDGHSIPFILDCSYNVIFSIICMQHIASRSWRLELYREFYRLLVPGGFFCFQMGFGPGHGLSVDYFHEYDETDTCHRDVRVEDAAVLQKDLEDQGFVGFDHVLTDPCHDCHPQWIWVRVQRPLR